MDAGTRGCKSVTHVFFSSSLILFVCGWVCSLRCFVPFRALHPSLSRSVCCSVLSSRAIDLREGFVLPTRRRRSSSSRRGLASFDFGSLFFFVFLFFFFLVRFFDFMVEESSGGICVFGSVRRTRGFALRFARSGGFRSSRDRGEWIPIRGSCS